MPAGSTWRPRNPNWRRSPPRWRRCSSNWLNNATRWRCWREGSPARISPRTLNFRVCNCPESPLSLPSRLVEQRPDVRQAEENLHAASADVGVAIANRLPSIALTADAGNRRPSSASCSRPAMAFGIAAGITQPIFDAGALRHGSGPPRPPSRGRRTIPQTVFPPFRMSRTRSTRSSRTPSPDAAGRHGRRQADPRPHPSQARSGYAGYLALLSAEQAYQQARSTWCRPKPIATPIPPRSFSPWEEDGGTAPTSPRVDLLPKPE